MVLYKYYDLITHVCQSAFGHSSRNMYIFGALLIISAQIYSTLSLPPCTCTRHLHPVCGSDGVDYANDCRLECAAYTSRTNITVAKEGPCNGTLPQVVLPHDQNCVCTMDYTPVCGSDGQTYPNECALHCESSALTVEYTGECRFSGR